MFTDHQQHDNEYLSQLSEAGMETQNQQKHDSIGSIKSHHSKQKKDITKKQKNLRDTLNTTFYTQGESIFENHQDQEHPIQVLTLNRSIERDYRHQSVPRNLPHVNQTSILEKRVKDQQFETFKMQTRNSDINHALTMIERNPKAQEILQNAIQKLHRDRMMQGAETSRKYQQVVRQRLKVQKS